MSDSLVQRIRDAIAERRGLAEDAVDPLADEWFEADGLCDRGMTRPDAAFIEAHSPAAVLAACKAAEELLSLSDDLWEYDPDSTEFRAARRIRASVAVMFGVSPTSKTPQRTEQ